MSEMDPFLEGNEIIEDAIRAYCANSTKETLVGVLEAVRTRMHADGHFMVPVVWEDEENCNLRTITTKDGKAWLVGFTSPEEYEKGPESQIISNFIDEMLKACKDAGAAGMIINPWGESLLMSNELIDMLFQADGDVEYHVPDVEITEELVEDGSFLKRVVGICNRNRTQLNLLKLAKILGHAYVWIPCNAVLADADREAWDKVVQEAAEKGDLDSLVGKDLTAHESVRLIPDILQNGEDFFFPVFTSEEEMGEYGEGFSKVEKPFLEAMTLVANNEKELKGIVINAFTEPFVVPKEMFDLIDGMHAEGRE